MQDQAIEGSVHYYTATEYDPTVDAIQSALNRSVFKWKLSSVEFEIKSETDPGIIHYEWWWQIWNTIT